MNVKEAREIMEANGFYDFPTPWIIRAAELCATEGVGADYEAWEEWMNRECNRNCIAGNKPNCVCGSCELFNWWDEMPGSIKGILYGIMSHSCEKTAEAMGWQPAVKEADNGS